MKQAVADHQVGQGVGVGGWVGGWVWVWECVCVREGVGKDFGVNGKGTETLRALTRTEGGVDTVQANAQAQCVCVHVCRRGRERGRLGSAIVNLLRMGVGIGVGSTIASKEPNWAGALFPHSFSTHASSGPSAPPPPPSLPYLIIP